MDPFKKNPILIIKAPVSSKEASRFNASLVRAGDVNLMKEPRVNRLLIVNPRKLEHGFRMINAGIPYTLP